MSRNETSLNNEELRDIRIAFIFSATLEGDDKSIWNTWKKFIDNRNNKGYYWGLKKVDKKFRRVVERNSNNLGILEDYITVENFFLSKQLFHVGKDYTMISRFIPDIELELTLPTQDRRKVKTTVIFSLYRGINVLTLTLNMHFKEIGVDDLIYIKSLKWHSIRNYEKAPKIEVIINGESKGEKYFYDVFDLITEEVFNGQLKINTRSESILDLIEIRDKKIGHEMLCGNHKDILYGLLVGDEGYMVNSDAMMEDYLSEPSRVMIYREYFKYFFAPTTILGIFSKDYPDRKRKFAKVYGKQYKNFEPLCKYIDLVSDVANLSDGLALVGEVTLVRYTVLKEIDLKIRGKFEEFEKKRPTLKDLLNLNKEIVTRLASIELLAKDVLWVNLLSSTDEMFGYNSIKKNLQERLGYIDSLITDEYNARIQNLLLWLTLVMCILTALMASMMILHH